MPPTKHAYCIVSLDGVSILIHIGVDTVKLENKNIFNSYVNQGNYVNVGQVICKYDRNKIIEANLDQRVMIIVTPESTKKIVNKFNMQEIKKEDVIFTL